MGGSSREMCLTRDRSGRGRARASKVRGGGPMVVSESLSKI